MITTQIDYRDLFQAIPGATALLTPDLVIIDANRDYLQVTGRKREDVIGRAIIDAFPPNPALRDRAGQRILRESLEAVLATGVRVHHAVPLA